MSVDLRAAAAEHLANRRARGYRLADHGWLLCSFLDALDARGRTTITVADAVAFAQARPASGHLWQATRLRAVRGLAAHVHALDPAAAELIPAGLIPTNLTRRLPYLYSDEQIATLMSGAAALSPALFAASMHTLIGLLAVTGLRSGEAVALDVEDLDADRRVLAVTGKYGKQRIVPLHHSTVEAVADYRQARVTAAAPTSALLVAAKGGRLRPDKARVAFRALADACNLPARPGCGPPRLHDLRHTFAVNSLLDAHRHGVDVDARIATLATFLGHVDPVHTYWYLTASPELMALVSDRVTAYQQGRRP
ncbi:MAG: tyrosine-type recombinase/integrase [Actinomycetota bacterium]|nr:tyrosine-type recombinase/integrase [Actinomycetota bacterium]